MRRIFEDRKEVLMKAISIASNRTIRVKQAVTGDWQVGWASVGSVDPRDAEYFADQIRGAVDVANMLTRQQIKFVEKEECDPDIDSDERFDECVKYVTKWFEEGEYRKIETWIIAGDVDEYEAESAK